MNFAPITHEMWQAFAEERRAWEIIDVTGAYVATDRKRFLVGKEFNNPMDVTYTAETCETREAAAYYIGIRSMQTALEKTCILSTEEKADD